MLLLYALSLLLAPIPTPASAAFPNGLRVTVCERHTVPLVAIDLWIRAGSAEERPGEYGAAHLLEHTLFAATPSRPDGRVDADIERLGGVLNAATGPDAVNLNCSVAPASLAAALELVADIVEHATLPDAAVERERSVILDELAERSDDPTSRLIDRSYVAACAGGAYGRSPGGAPADILARGRDTLAAFYRRTYRPDRAFLVIAGDVDAREALAAAERAFATWRASSQPAIATPPSAQPATQPPATAPESATEQQLATPGPNPPPHFAGPITESAAPASAATLLGVAYPAPPAGDLVATATAYVVCGLLEQPNEPDGNGTRASADTARPLLPRDAGRERVEIHFTPRAEPGLLVALVRGDTESAAAGRLERVRARARLLAERAVSPAALAAAKSRVLGRLAFDIETGEGLARAIGYAQAVGGEEPAALARRIAAVTAQDVALYARDYMVGARAQEHSHRRSAEVAEDAQRIDQVTPSSLNSQRPTLNLQSSTPLAPPRMTTLTDGVRLIERPEPEAGFVAICALVWTGVDADPQAAAVGEMVARSLLYGATNETMETLVGAMGDAGGSVRVRRARGYVAITCLALPRQLPEALYLICNALKNADFDTEALRRAYGDMTSPPDELGDAAARRRLSALLTDGPVADLHAAARVTTEAARAYFAARYTPANTVIAVVGAFDPRYVARILDDRLVDYDRPGGARPPRRQPATEPAKRREPDAKAGGATAYALIGANGPPPADPDFVPFRVLQTLLGGGHAARLWRDFREDRGLGYAVGATFQPERDEPLIASVAWDPAVRRTGAGGDCSPDHVAALLNSELDSLTLTAPTEDELERARSLAAGHLSRMHERAQDRAFLLAWYELLGAGYRLDADLPQRVAAVTPSDVRRVAERYLGRRVTLTLAPAQR